MSSMQIIESSENLKDETRDATRRWIVFYRSPLSLPEGCGDKKNHVSPFALWELSDPSRYTRGSYLEFVLIQKIISLIKKFIVIFYSTPLFFKYSITFKSNDRIKIFIIIF